MVQPGGGLAIHNITLLVTPPRRLSGQALDYTLTCDHIPHAAAAVLVLETPPASMPSAFRPIAARPSSPVA